MTDRGLPVLPGGISVDVPYVRLPRPATLFRARAARMRELADGHAARDWLLALASIGDAQHAAATAPVVGPPSVVDLTRRAPLARVAWQEDLAWRATLASLLAHQDEAPLPKPARDAVARLRDSPAAKLAAWTQAVVSGDAGDRPEPAAAPFLAGALQVHFARLAEHLPATEILRVETDCPLCASPATAGWVQGDDKVRYLLCSLCGSAWHRTRVQCATCGDPAKVSYFTIDDPRARGVKAEACGACHTYLKLFYREERPAAEPVADDLATVALDVLLGEEGFARGGVNLSLVA